MQINCRKNEIGNLHVQHTHTLKNAYPVAESSPKTRIMDIAYLHTHSLTLTHTHTSHTHLTHTLHTHREFGTLLGFPPAA